MNDKFEFNKRTKLILYTVLEVVGVAVLMLMSGALDWTNLSVDFARLRTNSFWSNAAIESIIYAIALVLGYLGTLQRNELQNQKFEAIYRQYLDILEHKKESFVVFIDTIFNPTTKRKFIKRRAMRRLYWLDRHVRDEHKLTYQSYISSDDKENFQWPVNENGQRIKGIYEYCIKREHFEELASDEYINANWRSIDCKYPVVNAAAFTDVLDFRMNSNAEYVVVNNTSRELPTRMALKIARGILSAIIVASFLFNPDTDALINGVAGLWPLFLKYMIRVFLILWNFGMGTFLGKNIFNRNYIRPLENRIRILKEYISWTIDNHIEETSAEKYLAQIEEAKQATAELQKNMQAAQELLSQLDKKENGS